MPNAALAEPGALSTVTVLNGPLCHEWPVEPAASGFYDPVVSDIPSLVFAGSYDPITPPAGTRAVAERLSNATFVEHPAESHAVMPLGDCESAIAQAFLADPTAPLDTSCIDALTAPSCL